jgi:hypothetical protein
MGIDFADKKFSSVAEKLFTSLYPYSPQEKLVAILLGTHMLGSDDMPPHLWQAFSRLRQKLCIEEDAAKGSFDAIPQSLTNEEATDYLRQFADLYGKIENEYRKQYSQ